MIIKAHTTLINESGNEVGNVNSEIEIDEDITWDELLYQITDLLPMFGYIIDMKVREEIKEAIYNVANNRLARASHYLSNKE